MSYELKTRCTLAGVTIWVCI